MPSKGHNPTEADVTLYFKRAAHEDALRLYREVEGILDYRGCLPTKRGRKPRVSVTINPPTVAEMDDLFRKETA